MSVYPGLAAKHNIFQQWQTTSAAPKAPQRQGHHGHTSADRSVVAAITATSVAHDLTLSFLVLRSWRTWDDRGLKSLISMFQQAIPANYSRTTVDFL